MADPIELTVDPPAPIELDLTPPDPIELQVATVGLVGPAGPAGTDGADGLDRHASHVQTTPASQWVWAHNTGRRTMPTLFLDGPGDDPAEPVHTDVTFIDDNTLTVSWPTPATGRIYL